MSGIAAESHRVITHEAIYLTGAAATGKSTLSRSLIDDQGFAVFEYGAEVFRRAAGANPSITHADTRESPRSCITASHIEATDEALQSFIADNRRHRHVVIDSHAVTKEPYGFRAVPFTPRGLAKAALSRIVLLYCEPEVLLERIGRDRQGRPSLTLSEAALFIRLQEEVAVAYSTSSGAPIHFLYSNQTPEVLRAAFLGLVGSPSY